MSMCSQTLITCVLDQWWATLFDKGPCDYFKGDRI